MNNVYIKSTFLIQVENRNSCTYHNRHVHENMNSCTRHGKRVHKNMNSCTYYGKRVRENEIYVNMAENCYLKINPQIGISQKDDHFREVTKMIEIASEEKKIEKTTKKLPKK